MNEEQILITGVSITNPEGDEIDAQKSGEKPTWPNQWVKLGIEQSGKYTLEVSVAKLPGRGIFVYTKNWPASKGPKNDVWDFPKTTETEEGATYATTLVVDFEGRHISAASNNICVVEMRDDGYFTVHEFSVQFHQVSAYLIYNETYHGPVVKRKGEFACPDLERRNITNPALRHKLFKYFTSNGLVAKLPEANPNYRCWAERIKYPRLKGAEKKGDREQLVIIAMASPIGMMFARNRKGDHVLMSVKNVNSAEGCPMGTVGSICWANLIEHKTQKGAFFAEDVEMLSDEESEAIFATMSGAKKTFLSDFHPHVEHQPEWKPADDNAGVKRSVVKTQPMKVRLKGTSLVLDVREENMALAKARPDGEDALELKFEQ